MKLSQHLRKTIESVVAAHGPNGDTNKWMNMVKSELNKKVPDHNRLRSMGKQLSISMIHIRFIFIFILDFKMRSRQKFQGSIRKLIDILDIIPKSK